MRWTYKPFPADEVGKLSVATGVSPVVAELLLRNGLATVGGSSSSRWTTGARRAPAASSWLVA